MLSIFTFIRISLSSENNVKPSCTQLETQIYLPPYSAISTRWHISAVARYIPSNWHSPSLKPKALPPGAWRTTQPRHYCQSKLCSVKQDSPLALWTWGVRVAGFESTGRALQGEMLSVGYRALPVACVLPAWHFLPLMPGCATAVTQDRAASRVMRRLGLLHKRERSGRARGLQMKNGNKRRASGKKSILFNSFICRPAGRAGLCCRSTGTRGRAHVGARKLSVSSRVSKWQSICWEKSLERIGERAELITHSITIIKRLLEALCLNMPFVIYYSLKEEKRSPSFLFKTKKSSTRDTFVFMSIILITTTISIQTTGEKWAEFCGQHTKRAWNY